MPSKDAQIKELLTRGVEETIPSYDALEKKLKEDKKITVYLGIDPTSPQLHLGHSVNLFKLKQFQDLGHKVTVLVGDFTARIGDPSGKTTQRKPLTKKEITNNLKTYKEQISRILNLRKTTFAQNSKWLDKLRFEEILGIASRFTVQQMLARDMFQNRLKEGNPINLSEFLYPIMQGYDSVALKTDAEIGGSDQLFNMLVGRDLVKGYLDKEKFVITSKLLINPATGAKMSKTEGNLVALNDAPGEMYAKIMAFPDELIKDCFELCTDIPMDEVGGIMKLPPRDAKARLAKEITTIYHGAEKAQDAEKEFDRMFRQHEAPLEIPEVKLKNKKINLVDLLVELNLVSSKSEARRVIDQKGVKIDGITKTDKEKEVVLKDGMVVQVGKRRFVRIKI